VFNVAEIMRQGTQTRRQYVFVHPRPLIDALITTPVLGTLADFQSDCKTTRGCILEANGLGVPVSRTLSPRDDGYFGDLSSKDCIPLLQHRVKHPPQKLNSASRDAPRAEPHNSPNCGFEWAHAAGFLGLIPRPRFEGFEIAGGR